MSKLKAKTFNVEPEKWERFKRLARANQSDTNKELRKFIERYLNENAALEQLLNEKEKKKE